MDISMPKLNGIEATRSILRLVAEGKSNAGRSGVLIVKLGPIRS
jgi:hypothetical protein